MKKQPTVKQLKAELKDTEAEAHNYLTRLTNMEFQRDQLKRQLDYAEDRLVQMDRVCAIVMIALEKAQQGK